MQVSKWLGHSTFTLTLDVYGDYIPEEDGGAVNNLPEPPAPAKPPTYRAMWCSCLVRRGELDGSSPSPSLSLGSVASGVQPRAVRRAEVVSNFGGDPGSAASCTPTWRVLVWRSMAGYRAAAIRPPRRIHTVSPRSSWRAGCAAATRHDLGCNR